eukprot:14908880-Alexandrium_andersonii.AAC.1
MAGWCSGPSAASTRTNMPALGRPCPGICAGLVQKLASKFTRSSRTACRQANVPTGGRVGAGAEEAAATSAK